MNQISDGVRGLKFILRLNADLLICIGALALALSAATWIAHP